MRRLLLEVSDQKARVMGMASSLLQAFLNRRCPRNTHPGTWDLAKLKTDVLSRFGCEIETAEFANTNRHAIEASIVDRLAQKYREKEDLLGLDTMRQTERIIMLQVIDDQWKERLVSMRHLREGIHLRVYWQKDPLVEYKKESFNLFQALMNRIEDETVSHLFFLQVSRSTEPAFALGRPRKIQPSGTYLGAIDNVLRCDPNETWRAASSSIGTTRTHSTSRLTKQRPPNLSRC